MKINKILLRICHFCGFRLNEEHQDDIIINIPTYYPSKFLDEIHDNKCNSNEAKWIMSDIMEQIYDRFKQYPITEKRCRNVKQVWVTYYSNPEQTGGGSIITKIPYIYESLERNRKIEQLLND